ncbi:ferric reductase NAD binding domain-containing protein [Xylariaceae sp. FL0016]|nr:ferric reductase NAD binding domain-containing protein [Xylariaceae sp. FL0016]
MSESEASPNEPWKEEYMAMRLQMNLVTLMGYACSLSALIGLFIAARWIRWLAVRHQWSRSKSPIAVPFIAFGRLLRKILTWPFPGFPSFGHLNVISCYVGPNIVLSLYPVNFALPTDLPARLGWMATANMLIVTFLSLKNTPLALLTEYSYEQLNCLHRVAGYVTLVQTILHGSIYSARFLEMGEAAIFQEQNIIAGIPLGFATLFTSAAGFFLMRRRYELFYVIHVALFIVIVVCLGLHRPSFEPDKTLCVTVIIACIWGADRLIRAGRLVYNGVNNSGTVEALPGGDGGVRILLKKHLMRARPGKHCYVWVPKVRAFETHPFTIVATNPLELVMSTYSGFTRDLYKQAASSPGAELQVSVEGPYGTIPDLMDFHKIVLVAGGAGATFTFGLVNDLLSRLPENSTKQIEFIWSVRGLEHMSWFTEHLNNLKTHPHAANITFKIYITRPSSPPTREKNSEERDLRGPSSSDDSEREEGTETAARGQLDIPTTNGRPDIADLIKSAVDAVDLEQRVLVAACGPKGMTKVVRSTTARCMTVKGPPVELHIENFGW